MASMFAESIAESAAASDLSTLGPRPDYEAQTTFKEFHISKSGLSNLQLSSQNEDKTHYYVETSFYNPAKPDVTVYKGTDAKGQVLGDIDLKNFSGHYTIELGDVAHEPVLLESLDRVKGFRSQHSFKFAYAEGSREKYIWRHPGETLLSNRDDLELVTDDDEEVVVLAKYLKSGGAGGWKGKGSLLIRAGGSTHWELMVVLSAMALVVSRRREQ